MRKMLVILGLVGITLVASASDAFAQRIRIGGRGGGITIGGGGYRGGNWGGGYYGGGYYGGGSYWGSPYYGRSYYGSPYYYGNRFYSSPGYYYSTPSYYYSSPGYYYSDSVAVQPAPDYSQSFYSDPSTAQITVLVPHPDAEVWFDDRPTNQRGTERLFTTASLQQGGTYTIKARWTDNGRVVNQQRQVTVQPGQSVTVNFQVSPSERVPLPK